MVNASIEQLETLEKAKELPIMTTRSTLKRFNFVDGQELKAADVVDLIKKDLIRPIDVDLFGEGGQLLSVTEKGEKQLQAFRELQARWPIGKKVSVTLKKGVNASGIVTSHVAFKNKPPQIEVEYSQYSVSRRVLLPESQVRNRQADIQAA